MNRTGKCLGEHVMEAFFDVRLEPFAVINKHVQSLSINAESESSNASV
jgi:hypothetical protein